MKTAQRALFFLASLCWAVPALAGGYSAQAQAVCSAEEYDLRHIRFASPDGHRVIRTVLNDDGDTALVYDAGGRAIPVRSGVWPCPEIGWSPDSNLVFVTFSEGGGVGTYAISTYRVSDEALEAIDLTGYVRRDFKRHYPKCFGPEDPNIVGVGWSADSRRLFVAAQVLPHSNCDDMGTFALYEVDASSGKPLHKYGQLEAKRLFRGLLGPELLDADDSCLLRPGSCFIPQLHRGSRARKQGRRP